MTRLREKYIKDVIPAMIVKFGYESPLAVPRFEKVVVNSGFGKFLANFKGQAQEKTLQEILKDLAKITGQKPALTLAKKSIAGFKVRQGQPVGAKVTLRGARMFDFLERLINIALPRTRDFRGIILKAIDRRGNLTVGVAEHTSFGEIILEKLTQPFGFEVTVATNAKSREEAIELYKLLGFPLKQ